MNTTVHNFDPQALARKYQEERDKRIRADGNDQYQEVTGDFAYFVEDPYIDSTLERDAIEEEVEVVMKKMVMMKNIGSLKIKLI